jgi:hypothetical protein
MWERHSKTLYMRDLVEHILNQALPRPLSTPPRSHHHFRGRYDEACFRGDCCSLGSKPSKEGQPGAAAALRRKMKGALTPEAREALVKRGY